MGWIGMLLGYIALKEVVSGVIGGAIASLAMFGLNWFKDRSLANHKEELGRESERLKSDMAQSSNQTLEHLRAVLGQAAETHKLGLRKREWLFDKELEAAQAFVKFKDDWVPSVLPLGVGLEEIAPKIFAKSDILEKQFRNYVTTFASVLPSSVTRELKDAYKRLVDGLSCYELDEESYRHPQSAGLNIISAFMEDCSKIAALLFELVRD